MKTDSPLYLHYKKKLSQSPVFSGLSDEILADMLGEFHHTTWRQGVVTGGVSLTERFYLIIDGRVKIQRIDAASGNRITLFLLGPGDGFDVISLLDNQPHEILPVALDDLQLLSAPRQTVREWISLHPEFNRNFLPYLGEQMRTIEELATDLATKDTLTRLARLILRHTIPGASSGQGGHSVRLIHDLHHDALAHMIGATRQVVNKHLRAMRNQGILDRDSHHLVVAELGALKEKAEKFLSRE
ncbi:CRP-like cAMP-binding protein [Thiogranum longum]|uniref:CRP-like cAMP-binding protein n=1 Tax=Thiogranum longum TaxID=1537524 RepID=A0A4R1HB57_9GAMM|nr:Crp/Fnr family transcriptional regulator [Thiogranum longum]TCK17390.1 CRP-like cAMP-binding protein [Thiogranum longum]